MARNRCWKSALAGLLGVAMLGCGLVAEAKTTVRFAMWGVPFEIESYREVVKLFEKKNPDIEVKFEQSGWGEYWTKVQTQMAAGVAPDIMRMSGAYLGQFVRGGAIYDIQPLIDRDKFPIDTDYFDTSGIFRFGGHYYGLPEGGDIAGLYYNMDAFDQAGVEYPDAKWTWADLRQAASKLTVRQANQVKQYGLYTLLVDNGQSGYLNFILQAGGRLLNSDKTKAATDTPEVIEAVKYLAGLVQSDQSTAPPTWGGDPLAAFNQGQFAMITGLVPVWIKLFNEAKFNWDVAPLPVGKRRAATGNFVGFVMPKSTKVSEAAWKLMKFFAGSEGQTIIARNRQMLPPLKSIAMSKEFLNPSKPPKRLLEVMQVTTPHTYDLQFTNGWFQWTGLVGSEIAAAVGGAKSVEIAMKTAAEKVNNVLASGKK